MVQSHHDQVALIDGYDRSLTYSDMSARIQSTAEALKAVGVSAGDSMVVFQQPSVEWSCSMLAIMRLGAIYFPLGLRNPTIRLAGVSRDREAMVVLAEARTVNDAPQLNVNLIINVSELPTTPSVLSANNAQASSVAAILYTSGPTGTPRGVAVTHAGLRNEIGLGAERVFMVAQEFAKLGLPQLRFFNS